MTDRPEIDFDELFGWRGRRQRRAGPRPKAPGRAFWVIVAVVALLILLSRALALYLDWLWFDSIGQRQVLVVRVLAPLGVFALALSVGLLWLGANWRLAAMGPAGGAGGAVRPPEGLGRAAVIAALATAALMALVLAPSWSSLLLYRARGAFGVTDPLFGLDVSFHVFTVPVLLLLQRAVGAWIGLALVGSAALYAASGLLTFDRRSAWAPGAVRAHLFVLAGLGALVWAGGAYLERFELLHQSWPGKLFTGAGFAAATVTVPALGIMAGCAVALAVFLTLSARTSRWLLPVGAVAVALALWVGLIDVLPALVQRYGVLPNEFTREEPYIADAITMTRSAYRLDQIVLQEYAPDQTLTSEVLSQNSDTVSSIRLWDWRVLQAMFEQLQEIRTYYRFLDVDVDRYQTSDGLREVMLALRELDQSQLRNRTWVNERLQFTHGYGLVMTPVNEVDSAGQAVFWAKDIPVQTVAPLQMDVSQPRVYFGQAQDNRYVVVDTTTGEFDYPSGNDNAYNRYDGADGVTLDSWWRRLLFAARFGDVDVLLSDAIRPDSRILLHRNISDRVAELAPFLRLDPDPYVVLTRDGRLVWIYDAYTVTDRYPYAQQLGTGVTGAEALAGANYVRNSVKVVVDAYDGRPRLYLVDPADPIAAAWSRVYPGLFEVGPAPEEMVRHWRYPEALFRAQAEVLLRYHMTDPKVFYNAEDLWAVPIETRAQEETEQVEPYYVTMRLRGQSEAEFVLMLPFSPARKDLMISWLAARSDPPHYGEMVLYEFPKGAQVDGPQLVENQIDNDTEISAQLTLWSQAGSQTIRGNLLAIPIENALLWVEPLFLQPGASALPGLKRVIVASGDKVSMQLTLEQALDDLLGQLGTAAPAAEAGAPAAAPEGAAAPVAPTPAPTASEVAATPEAPAAYADLIRQAAASEAAARDALARGDWSTFGREMDVLQSVLDQLARAAGSGTATAPPTP